MSVEVLPLGVRCQLRCDYCYQNNMRDGGNIGAPSYDMDAMKASLAAELLRKGKKAYESARFSLFGGEPLLVPLQDLCELWAWGLEHFGVNGIQTNAALISDDHIAAFKRYKVQPGVSMDGPAELNDMRWAGTLAATRAQTAKSEAALRRLLTEGLHPSLIVTLHRGNAAPHLLPRLVAWLEELAGLGLVHVNVHLLESESADIRTRLVLSDDDNAVAVLVIGALMDRTPLRVEPLLGMVKLLLGADERVDDQGGRHSDTHCVWNACDPYTTDAVHGVLGDGTRTNCGRTNKDGVNWVKAEKPSRIRQLVLHQTPQEHGGCQGCRFFFACKGQCYSDDTEVLTRDGFKLFKDLSLGDELATRQDDGSVTYEQPLEHHRYQFDGELLHFSQKGLDLLVTPDHPMLVWNQTWKPRHVTAAKSAKYKTLRIRQDWSWTGREVSRYRLSRPSVVRGKAWCTTDVETVVMDAWLEFLGWYISEGSTGRGQQHVGKAGLFGTSIGQKDKVVVERVAGLLRGMGFVATIGFDRRTKMWRVRNASRQLHEELAPLGKAGRKYVPSYVKELTPRQIRIFLSSLFDGDGSSRLGRWEAYYTASPRLAADVQELLLRCGLGATVVPGNNQRKRDGWHRNHDGWVVYVKQRTRSFLPTPKSVRYSGYVYDVTMPHSPTIFVRRNGRVVWGHNCPGTSIDGDWRQRTEHCGTLMRVFEQLEGQLRRLGQQPISGDAGRRRIVEERMLAAFAAGRSITVAAALRGDVAVGADVPHGDVAHQDTPHEDHDDAEHPHVTHGDSDAH